MCVYLCIACLYSRGSTGNTIEHAGHVGPTQLTNCCTVKSAQTWPRQPARVAPKQSEAKQYGTEQNSTELNTAKQNKAKQNIK